MDIQKFFRTIFPPFNIDLRGGETYSLTVLNNSVFLNAFAPEPAQLKKLNITPGEIARMFFGVPQNFKFSSDIFKILITTLKNIPGLFFEYIPHVLSALFFKISLEMWGFAHKANEGSLLRSFVSMIVFGFSYAFAPLYLATQLVRLIGRAIVSPEKSFKAALDTSPDITKDETGKEISNKRSWRGKVLAGISAILTVAGWCAIGLVALPALPFIAKSVALPVLSKIGGFISHVIPVSFNTGIGIFFTAVSALALGTVKTVYNQLKLGKENIGYAEADQGKSLGNAVDTNYETKLSLDSLTSEKPDVLLSQAQNASAAVASSTPLYSNQNLAPVNTQGHEHHDALKATEHKAEAQSEGSAVAIRVSGPHLAAGQYDSEPNTPIERSSEQQLEAETKQSAPLVSVR